MRSRLWVAATVVAGLAVVIGLVGLSGGAQVQAQAVQFSATLSGDAEVPPVETDGQGSFAATLEVGQAGESISFGLAATDIVGVTQAHIHIGPADDNGPIVAFLFGLVEEGVDGVDADGNLTAADLTGPLEGGTIADLVAEMRAGNAYVNVHTLVNAGGEIRGQIFAILPAGEPELENGDGAPEPEAFNILVLNAGGQFVFWPFGLAQAADVFGTVKIAWLFDATAVSWISFIPALGQTDFALIDGDVLWVVSETAHEIEIPCGTTLNPCG